MENHTLSFSHSLLTNFHMKTFALLSFLLLQNMKTFFRALFDYNICVA